MKKIFLFIFIIQSLFISANPGINIKSDSVIEKGIIKGRITDSKGAPVANARVVIEHTMYYATYVYAISDKNGFYKATVPNGSWRASVQIERKYLGNTYKFDLHPDNAEAFAGASGAIRNFTWKLYGPKPQGGFYGNNVAVYLEPGSSLLIEDVEITLTPDGPLVDGNTGQTITKTLIDIGGGEDGIRDVPLGKYMITARNKTTHQLLQVRIRNTGNYSSSITAVFTSGFTASTSYQIVVQVN